MIMEILVGIFGMILTSLGTVLIMQFKKMDQSVEKMANSVQNLNEKIATIVANQDWHYREINEIKERMNVLEQKDK